MKRLRFLKIYVLFQLDDFIKEQNVKEKVSNKAQRNSTVLLKQIDKNIRSVTGEKSDMDLEISLIFPVKSMEELSDVEERLKDDEFTSRAVRNWM